MQMHTRKKKFNFNFIICLRLVHENEMWVYLNWFDPQVDSMWTFSKHNDRAENVDFGLLWDVIVKRKLLSPQHILLPALPAISFDIGFQVEIEYLPFRYARSFQEQSTCNLSTMSVKFWNFFPHCKVCFHLKANTRGSSRIICSHSLVLG